MRRGRALLPHPEPIWHEPDDVLLSRQVVAYLTGRNADVIRKRVPVVACHVATRTMLVSRREAAAILGTIPTRGKADALHDDMQ